MIGEISVKYLPNILTTIRLLLVFVYIAVYITIEKNVTYLMIIFFVAGATDILDGYIARKYHLITKWGQVMDPLADKLMQITVLVTLGLSGYIADWIVVIFLLKEAFMILSGVILYFKEEKVVIPSNYFGKVTTIMIYLAVVVSIVYTSISNYLFIVVLMFSLVTLGQYMIIGYNQMKSLKEHK